MLGPLPPLSLGGITPLPLGNSLEGNRLTDSLGTWLPDGTPDRLPLNEGPLPMLSLGGITPLPLGNSLEGNRLTDSLTEARDRLDSDSLTDENDFAEPEP
jgi:hypothetical protein